MQTIKVAMLDHVNGTRARDFGHRRLLRYCVVCSTHEVESSLSLQLKFDHHAGQMRVSRQMAETGGVQGVDRKRSNR